MDKSANFFICDFQAHGSRDINWMGAKFGVNTAKVNNLNVEELNS